jgi:hypothetical protein
MRQNLGPLPEHVQLQNATEKRNQAESNLRRFVAPHMTPSDNEQFGWLLTMYRVSVEQLERTRIIG